MHVCVYVCVCAENTQLVSGIILFQLFLRDEPNVSYILHHTYLGKDLIDDPS